MTMRDANPRGGESWGGWQIANWRSTSRIEANEPDSIIDNRSNGAAQVRSGRQHGADSESGGILASPDLASSSAMKAL